MCTKTLALRFLIKICVPHLGMAVLRAVDVTNAGRNERKLRKPKKLIGPDYVARTAFYQLISCSFPAISIETLHVVLS